MHQNLNAYIVYDLDNWPKSPFRKFLFGATNKVKHSGKERYVYSGYEIGFDGKGEWDFGNDFAQNVVTFGVGNSSSSHINNYKNNF